MEDTSEQHNSYMCWLANGNHDRGALFAHADGQPEQCKCRCHD